jgi:hypothetical protein
VWSEEETREAAAAASCTRRRAWTRYHRPVLSPRNRFPTAYTPSERVYSPSSPPKRRQRPSPACASAPERGRRREQRTFLPTSFPHFSRRQWVLSSGYDTWQAAPRLLRRHVISSSCCHAPRADSVSKYRIFFLSSCLSSSPSPPADSLQLPRGICRPYRRHRQWQ